MLRALTQFGDDLPGNLVMGEVAFQRFHTLPERASRVASAADYPALADQAMQGTHPGSSAGGEQPKFCTINAGRHVIVKFSPAGNTAVDQRTRDLLVCEHLALLTLAQAGISAANTQIFTGAGRVFLESERFDRCGERGRIGMVSLQVYDAEYVVVVWFGDPRGRPTREATGFRVACFPVKVKGASGGWTRAVAIVEG